MRKHYLTAVLALVMCLGLMRTASAWTTDGSDQPYPVTGGNLYLYYSEGSPDSPAGLWVSVCDNTVTEAVIPASIDGIPVIGITIYAFQGCASLERVTIPESVSAIGAYVFGECENLKHVTILGSMTYLDDGDFSDCPNLESITIPASVTRICSYAFEECTSLKDVYYAGSESDWNRVTIEKGNDALTSATIHYNSSSAAEPSAPAEPAAPVKPAAASPTASTVLVNGKETAFDAYNINGNNYFKLRDLAYVLNGTDKQFEVEWDAAANAISLISSKAYTAVGGEMSSKGTGSQTAAPTTSKILLDGKEVSLTAYNIGGNNYFKLRDVGEAFNFGVDWDAAAKSICIDTAKSYTPES